MLSRSAQDGYTFDDGLQLASTPCGEEKYQGRLHDDPLYPLDRDHEGLQLSNEQHINGLGRTSQVFEADQQSQKQAVKQSKKFMYIISVAISLIIIAAIVGGVVGSRKAQTNQKNSQEPQSPTPTLSPNSSSSQTTKSTQAYNGTSFAATAYSYSADPTYFLIYQNANGDIQKVVYNGAGWQKPVYIANDARLGTGLTTAWLNGTSDNEIWIYYIDKANKLQELRGAHGSDTWKQGTLGNAGFEDATPGSAISIQYVGDCASGVNAWLCYQTSTGTIRQISWNAANDSWTSGVNFPELKPQSGFVTYNRDSVWRVFAMDTDSHVVQYDCVDCCRSVKWNQGLSYSFPQDTITPDPVGIGAIGVGQRRLRYQSSDGLIRNLNNSGDPGKEVYANTPLVIGKAMLGTKMAIADGSVLLTDASINGQPVKAFYQVNGSDVTVTSWEQDAQHLRTTIQLSLGP